MAALFIFMIIYYQVFGIVADLVLVANVVVLGALLTMLGVALSFVGLPPLRTLNELLVLTQPAHLTLRAGREIGTAERNALRAELVRTHLERAIDETGGGSRG